MYDRALRFPASKPQTPAPNAYYLPEELDVVFEGVAPFLSLAQRFPKKAWEKQPGPTDYEVTLRKHIKGGESVSYKAARFQYTRPLLQKHKHGAVLESKDVPLEPQLVYKPARPRGVGRVYRGHMPYSLLGRAPSIPPMRGFSGYRCTAYGQLVAMKVDVCVPLCRDCCFQCSKAGTRCHCRLEGGVGQCFTTLRYRGCFFSRRTSQRQTFQPREGPGPADYNVHGPGPSAAWLVDEAVRQWKRRTCRQPRFVEIVERRAVIENIPGVGQYDTVNKRSKKIIRKHGIFLTSSKRMPDLPAATAPAPGQYHLRSGLLPSRPGSMAGAPFLRFAERFPPPPESVAPGPGAYEVKSTLGSAAVASRQRSPGAPFDSSAPRRLDFQRPDAELEPGPGSYQPRPKSPPGGGCVAVFRSRTAQTSVQRAQEQPDCWTYDPRQPGGSHHRGQLSFCARTRRFGPVRDWPSNTVEPRNPGPDQYNQQDPPPCRLPTRPIFGDSPRFPSEKPRAPGPGQYTITRHPKLPTFNVTLDCTASPPRGSRLRPPGTSIPAGSQGADKGHYHFAYPAEGS